MDDLEAALAPLAFAPPSLPFVSNLTGRTVAPGEALDSAYWRRQMRAPVAFRACIETLAGLGVDAVVEIGPHAVLGPMTSLAWPDSGAAAAPAVVSSLRRPATGEERPAPGSGGGFVEAVAGAWEAGLPLRFDGIFAGEARRRVALPGYPFQRERYWVESPKRRRQGAGHPLLGVRHDSASGEIGFDTELFPSDPAWLADHRVFGRLVAPGALYGAMAASACIAEGAGSAVVEDFQMQSALVFPEGDASDGSADEGRRLQVLLDGSEEGSSRRVRILSRGADDEEWTLHAEGRVSTRPGSGPPAAGAPLDPARLKAGLAPVDLPAYYRAKADVGIDLGPSFRTLRALWSRPGEALAEVSVPGYPRPQRAGGSSARAGRLLSGDGSSPRTGRKRRGGHLAAVRVGATRVAGAVAGAAALPRAREGETGGRGRRIAGGGKRRHRSLRLGRIPDRHTDRVHGETCDACGAARSNGGRGGPCFTKSYGATVPCRRACRRRTSCRGPRSRLPARSHSPGI